MPRPGPSGLLLAVLLILLAAAALVLVLRSGGSGPDVEPSATAPAADEGSRKPNLIVLMTDDLGLAGYERALPRTRKLLGARGSELTQAIVSTPLCCPSRASFLSGRYAHNTRVLANDPGYPALDSKHDVLPVWLQRAGYRTALVGKFMNGYDRTRRGEELRPAPGWDEWIEMRRTFGYYDYPLNVNGEIEQWGTDREDYLTDVLTEHATRIIRDAADGNAPLFLWVSWWAPHPENSGRTEGPCQGSAIPPDREPGEFSQERLPDRPSIDEADISDKPRFLRGRRDLRPADRERARMSYRCRLASLGAVDRGVEAILAALEETGELDDTALLFTSDNGFFHLEHRIPDGKGLPYEEAIRVPLLIDLPASSGRQKSRVPVPVSNIDLAPTLLDLAGVEPCRARGSRCTALDGVSLLPLLKRGARDSRVRDRALLIEAADGKPCPYSAVRTQGWLYAEHGERADEPLCPGGDRELYDLAADPHQLDNLLAARTAEPPPGTERRLRGLLRRLRDCAGNGKDGRVRGRSACS